MSAVSNKAISEYLSKFGIYHSSRAYEFLLIGIRAILDGAVDRYRAGAIYDYVAKQTGVQPDQVDRSIRQAIRKASGPVHVPNKEFLIRAVDELTFTADANAFLFGTAKTAPGGQIADSGEENS